MNIKYNQLILKIALQGIVLAGGVIGFADNGRAEQTAPAASRPALTVRTTALREDKWARTLAANGSIIPWQEAIISAQIQGLRIAEVKVSIGDRVQPGRRAGDAGQYFAHRQRARLFVFGPGANRGARFRCHLGCECQRGFHAQSPVTNYSG